MKIFRVWLWLIPLTLFWPVLHLLVFGLRFGSLPSGGVPFFLVFLPMGLVSGIVFLFLWTRTAKRPHRVGLMLGYLFASPIALIGSLLSGLVYQPIIGTLLWGAGPLVIGMLGGVLVGYFLAKIKPN